MAGGVVILFTKVAWKNKLQYYVVQEATALSSYELWRVLLHSFDR